MQTHKLSQIAVFSQFDRYHFDRSNSKQSGFYSYLIAESAQIIFENTNYVMHMCM